MDELLVISNDFRDICNRCIKKWGWRAQKIKLIEEMGELIQALAKHDNDLGSWHDVIEEAVDVELMLNQLKGFQVSPLWFDLRDQKLQYLRQRLEEP